MAEKLYRIMATAAPSHLETRGAPVDKLDGALGLDGGDGGIHVLGHHVTPVEHAARHVLPLTQIII